MYQHSGTGSINVDPNGLFTDSGTVIASPTYADSWVCNPKSGVCSYTTPGTDPGENEFAGGTFTQIQPAKPFLEQLDNCHQLISEGTDLLTLLIFAVAIFKIVKAILETVRYCKDRDVDVTRIEEDSNLAQINAAKPQVKKK